jgi:predicted Rossmann-fold nucleotide-binding protein
LHRNPIGFLNVAGYYNALKQQMLQMQNSALLKPEHRACAIFDNEIESLLKSMQDFQVPDLPKWLNSTELT